MANSNFLQLTNKVLGPFNEVQLNASTFSSAVGFQAEARNYINQAIFDIYTFEDTQWPFAWQTYNQDTIIGGRNYNKDTSATSLDWMSFKVQRATAICYTLTQVGGIATFTSIANHNFITGDNINIYGASDINYTGDFIVTVVSPTVFTYSVNIIATSPAVGTIVAKSNSIQQRTLKIKDIDSYRDEYYDDDDAARNSDGYGLPVFVIRNPDNNYYLSPTPDRVYTIGYAGYNIPVALSLYSDTCDIPEPFEQVIIDRALHYAYMFRDNLEQAALVDSRYKDNIYKMRRILIQQFTYFRA